MTCDLIWCTDMYHSSGKTFDYSHPMYANTVHATSVRSDKKDPRLVILLKKLQTLKREVKRVPSLVEWEQCLHGILRTGKKLSEFVENTDHYHSSTGAPHPVTPPVVLYDAALRKKMHMDYFKLIQTALQSGPMAG